MDYARVKRNIRIGATFGTCVASVFLSIGLLLLIVALTQQEARGVGLFFGLFFSGIAYAAIRSVRTDAKFQIARFTAFEEKTFDWYRNQYPKNVQPDGVTCWNCGSRNIKVRGLQDRTYHREHACGRCGQTLYYSPEGNL